MRSSRDDRAGRQAAAAVGASGGVAGADRGDLDVARAPKEQQPPASAADQLLKDAKLATSLGNALVRDSDTHITSRKPREAQSAQDPFHPQ
jgi:hypothetical protein